MGRGQGQEGLDQRLDPGRIINPCTARSSYTYRLYIQIVRLDCSAGITAFLSTVASGPGTKISERNVEVNPVQRSRMSFRV